MDSVHGLASPRRKGRCASAIGRTLRLWRLLARHPRPHRAWDPRGSFTIAGTVDRDRHGHHRRRERLRMRLGRSQLGWSQAGVNWAGVNWAGVGFGPELVGAGVGLARTRLPEPGGRTRRCQLTPTARPIVEPISPLITRSAISSWSVGSRLTMTRRDPFCLAMMGKPAAG